MSMLNLATSIDPTDWYVGPLTFQENIFEKTGSPFMQYWIISWSTPSYLLSKITCYWDASSVIELTTKPNQTKAVSNHNG